MEGNLDEKGRGYGEDEDGQGQGRTCPMRVGSNSPLPITARHAPVLVAGSQFERQPICEGPNWEGRTRSN